MLLFEYFSLEPTFIKYLFSQSKIFSPAAQLLSFCTSNAVLPHEAQMVVLELVWCSQRSKIIMG